MKKNSIFIKCTIIFFVILFVISSSSNVFAISSTDNIGSLKIVLEDIDNLSESIDLNLHIYYIKKAVDVDENTIGFEFVDEFENVSYIDEKWNENNVEYIDTLKRYIKENNIQGMDFTLDYINEAGFMDMSLGKYLIVVDNFYVNGKEYECNSLIVDVPIEETKGYYNFSITANIKSSMVLLPNDDGYDKNINKIEKLPDTGLPFISIIVVSVLGLILIIIGCFLDKNKKKEK